MSDREIELDFDRTVSADAIGRAATPENLAIILETQVNVMGRGFDRGKAVGERLTHSHRTLQRSAVLFMLGVIVGLSEQEHTDARNATAIESAKKIATMVENEELPFGGFV